MRNEIGSSADKETLKKEIKAELRHEAIRRHVAGFFSCLFLIAAAVAIPVFVVAHGVAKTGLVDVPVLSGKGISMVMPVRTVVPLGGSSPEDVFARIMASATYEQTTDRVTFKISEQQLTTVIAPRFEGMTIGSGERVVEVVRGQVALDDDIELYVVIRRDEHETAVALTFTPYLEKGRFRMEPKKLVIGELRVPGILVSTLLKPAIGPLEDVLNDSLGDVRSVREFRTDYAELQLTVDRP